MNTVGGIARIQHLLWPRKKGILPKEILQSFRWMFALFVEIQKKFFTDLFTKKQGWPIMTNTIGMKPLILRKYRKRLSISRKGENGSLSGRSIWILKTDTCNGTTMTIPLSFAISKPWTMYITQEWVGSKLNNKFEESSFYQRWRFFCAKKEVFMDWK